MARPHGSFRLEAAGSLTPELDGISSSRKHDRAEGNRRERRSEKKNGEDGKGRKNERN